MGVGVMIVLLAVGEAMVRQASQERLVGGGTITVLPEGIDIEVLTTGGLGGGADRFGVHSPCLPGGGRLPSLVGSDRRRR